MSHNPMGLHGLLQGKLYLQSLVLDVQDLYIIIWYVMNVMIIFFNFFNHPLEQTYNVKKKKHI
jgi:hypothetical protein